ncbi:MAG: CapA family protein [Nitrospinota bacterium]|nr:CapA family protein [Nitrospinota bacterium]
MKKSTRQFTKSCTFLTGGDVAPDRKSSKNLLGKTATLFKKADYSFVNLEHNLSKSGTLMKGKPTHHRGKPELIKGFIEAGFDALIIANNHMMDFGVESFYDTLELLKEKGIPFTGAGKNLKEAKTPVALTRNGLKIGLLAYTTTLPQGSAADIKEPGVNPMRVHTHYTPIRNPVEYPGSEMLINTKTVPTDLARMKREISTLKKKTDVVLVYNHWGSSMSHDVSDYQQEIGHAAVDAGACAVFGGHQHVLQGIEFYKGCPIVHCTGNLIFDIVEPFFTEATHQTFLFGGTLSKKGIIDPYIIPCRCGIGNAPKILSPLTGDGKEITRFLGELSKPFGTSLKISKGKIFLTS